MKIIVDADACAKDVLIICMKLGHQYSIQVWAGGQPEAIDFFLKTGKVK